MVRSPLVHSIAALGTVFAILTACDQPQMAAPGDRVDADRFVVAISPARDSLVVGATLGLTATVTDARGVARTDQTVRWNSLSPDIAGVDGSGLVTGVAVGTAPIVAMVGLGAQLYADTAVMLVQAGTLTLSIVPELAELTLGDSLRLRATLRTPSGVEVQGRAAQWSTSDQTVATISQEGVVTSVSPGDAILTATVSPMTATATVRVLPNPVHSISVAPANSGVYPGDTVQLVATARDASGRILPVSNVTWSTSSPNVAEVTPDGVLYARAMGAALITANAGGRRASATVTVFAVPAAEVSVTAAANSVPSGGRLKAIATARDAAGNVLSGRRIAWSSSNPAVAQIDADGTITGLVVGSTSIHAIVDSKIGTLPISVVSATPTNISVLPVTASVSLGKTAQLTAELRDQGGNIMSGIGFTWTSANPSVASVNSSGLVTAMSTGTVMVTATAGALSAQASITVIASSIASVAVAPSASQILIGGQQQLIATVAASNGGQVPNAAIAWTSSNPAVVSVSALGVATGIAPGNATITATSSGISGSAIVAVSSPAPLPVNSVTIAFNSPSLVVGQVTQAMAVPRDANGNTITGKTVVWSSADPPLASVSTTGLVTAIAGGTATIIATIDGVVGYATIAIGAPTSLPVHAVQLSIAPSTISAGQTVTSSVVLRDSLGRTLVGRTIAWSSSMPNVATVGLGGVITGVAGGTAVITATSEGKSGSAIVTVTAIPTVATVTVSASLTSLNPGQSTQATVTIRDAAGTLLVGQAVTWLSSNPGVAAVSATGIITGVAVGVTTVTATAGGKSGSVGITVVNPTAASYTIPGTVDATGTADVTGALTAFFSSVPDGSTVHFPLAARYRVEGTLLFTNRNNLTLQGNGATIVALTDGSGVTPPPLLSTGWPRTRRHVMFHGGSGITIRNLGVVGANPFAGLSDQAYNADFEAQHAFEFDGVAGVLLDGVRATDVWGDFVYLGKPSATGLWTSNVTVRNSHFDRNGRQGIAITAARDVLFENNYIGNVRRSSIDIEPNNQTGGAEHVRFANNTFGPTRLNFLANGGWAGIVNDITLENNTLIDHALKIQSAPNPGGNRRSNIRVLNNTSNVTFGTTGPTMFFERVDGVTVTGNTQPMQLRNPPMIGVRTVESCKVVVSGNVFTNAGAAADIQPWPCP